MKRTVNSSTDTPQTPQVLIEEGRTFFMSGAEIETFLSWF